MSKCPMMTAHAGMALAGNQNALAAGECGPVHNRHRDGRRRSDGHFGAAPVCQPNSFGGSVDDPAYPKPPLKVSGDADRYDHRKVNDDQTQVGKLYRLVKADEQSRLVANLVGAMKGAPRVIEMPQIGHFHKADPGYGSRVADGLGVDVREVIGKTA